MNLDIASPSLIKAQSSVTEKGEAPKNLALPGTPFPSINTVDDLEKLNIRKEIAQSVGFANDLFSLKELKDKIMKAPCEYIILKGAFFGDINISPKYVSFLTTEKARSDEPPFKFGALKSILFATPKRKQLRIKDIVKIYPRRYNFFKSSFEIYKKSGCSYFFNVYHQETRDEIIRIITKLNPKVEKFSNQNGDFEKSDYTNKWLRHEISNFEYLMTINMFAGRSFNNINEYPVFPWILTNYSCEHLDLSDENNYRDLGKPVGALNSKNVDYYLERYNNLCDPQIPKFHYGTHYSSACIVMYFLIRLEPFTSLAIELQNGKFDIPDRIFANVSATWNSCYSNASDVKELIPEFFYFPEFLKNM